jgi:hypothetical protein
MPETKMLPWMLAGIFGQPPEQSLQQAVFLAPNREMAIAMFVSASHTQQGVTGMLMAIACDEIKQDVIEAARRGMTGPAPVLSMVPKTEPEAFRLARECRHNPYYKQCTCDSVSCVLLRSTGNPAGLESLGSSPYVAQSAPTLPHEDQNNLSCLRAQSDHLITGHIFRPRGDGHCLLCGVRKDEHVHVYDEPQPAG